MILSANKPLLLKWAAQKAVFAAKASPPPPPFLKLLHTLYRFASNLYSSSKFKLRKNYQICFLSIARHGHFG
jgi:hypothetical protein